jgi:hypothetical protein
MTNALRTLINHSVFSMALKKMYTDRQKKWDIKKIHLYLSMYVIFFIPKVYFCFISYSPQFSFDLLGFTFQLLSFS